MPFACLIGLGTRFHTDSIAPTALYPEQRLRYFVGAMLAPSTLSAPVESPVVTQVDFLPVVLIAIWACGFQWVIFRWWREWKCIRVELWRSRPFDLSLPIPVALSPGTLEPGVAGIWKPVLLLPKGVIGQLTSEQLCAIIEHEMCHVRRRDNLAAAIHMAVEALFWFHPLVWWLGQRLAGERERACDEQVLRSGHRPEIYAESILRVCELCLKSPLPCVTRVTGSDLKRRMRTIMTHEGDRDLTWWRKALLAGAGFAAVAIPVGIGVLGMRQANAQELSPSALKFEVASIRRQPTEDFRAKSKHWLLNEARFSASNIPLLTVITFAYHIPFLSSQLRGAPEWTTHESFEIDATIPGGLISTGMPAKVRNQKLRDMLQSLLVDRCKLKILRETKEMSAYALVVGKGGPKLKKADIDDVGCSKIGNGSFPCHMLSGGEGHGMYAKAADMSDLVMFVSNWMDRPVVDRTELTGLYEIDTEGWSPVSPRSPDDPRVNTEEAAGPPRPTLFAILERLGLKLESAKASVDLYEIESIEHPSEN